MRTMFAAISVLALLGCDKPRSGSIGDPGASAAEQAPTPSGEPAAAPAEAVLIEENSPALEFTFGWPADAAAIPALDRRFRQDLVKARAETSANAVADMRLAKGEGREFHRHSFSRTWSTAGRSGRLLSLEVMTGFFTGGAHPNSGVDSLLWDRQAGREIGVADLFEPPTRFAELVSADYCRALDAERLDRRQGEQLEGDFAQCPSLSDLAIVPADADNDGRFESVRFVAAPYVAGPSAEGEYEIALPVTPRLVVAMKPGYRSSFEPQLQ